MYKVQQFDIFWFHSRFWENDHVLHAGSFGVWF